MTTFKNASRLHQRIIGPGLALVALFSGCGPIEVEPGPADLTAVSTAPPETPSAATSEGVSCATDADCGGVSCLTSFRDADGDGYGGLAIRRCGESPPPGHVLRGGDCCDADAQAHPGVSLYQPSPNACGSFDWDCSGAVERFPDLPDVDACGCVGRGSKFTSSCVTCK